MWTNCPYKMSYHRKVAGLIMSEVIFLNNYEMLRCLYNYEISHERLNYNPPM